MTPYLIFLLLTVTYSIKVEETAGKKNTDVDKYIDLSQKGECGQVKIFPSRKSKIVNGNDCSFGEYPWQVVFLEHGSLIKKRIYCGGSLITDQWIITAAHCFEEGSNLEEYFARLGEHDLFSTKELQRHVDRGLAQIVIHPEYDNETLEYDVELVKMEAPVTLQKNVQPICLYNQNKLLIGKFLTATGWGVIFEDGIHPAILQKVALPVIRNKECEKMFLEEGEVTPIGKMFICAGYRNGKFDACNGDSGGPLQMQLKNNKWALVGIVSWGYGCGRYQKPGLFTRVSIVAPWIISIVEEELEEKEDYNIY